jgi:hypothetical protein
MNVRARLPLIALGSLSLALLAQTPTEEQPAKKPQVATPKAKKSSSGPISSKDQCQSDADCVPATPCHAKTCAPAPRKVADIPCTMECRGGTVDCGYNHCGCVKGRSGRKACALVPGPKR